MMKRIVFQSFAIAVDHYVSFKSYDRYRGGLRKVGGLELKRNFVLTTHMIKSFVIISTNATMKSNFKITELLA